MCSKVLEVSRRKPDTIVVSNLVLSLDSGFIPSIIWTIRNILSSSSPRYPASLSLPSSSFSTDRCPQSDLSGLTFQCQAAPSGESCICAYPSSTPSSCTVSGEDILSYLEIEGTSYGKWAAIMVGIFFIYRIVYVLPLPWLSLNMTANRCFRLYCALRWRS